jgi:hypothetical protein
MPTMMPPTSPNIPTGAASTEVEEMNGIDERNKQNITGMCANIAPTKKAIQILMKSHVLGWVLLRLVIFHLSVLHNTRVTGRRAPFPADPVHPFVGPLCVCRQFHCRVLSDAYIGDGKTG